MRIGLISLLLFCAAPAAAQTHATVALAPGQSVRVTLAPGGVTVADDGKAELRAEDRGFLDKIRRAYSENGSTLVAEKASGPLPPIAPDSARIGLILVDGKETLLMIENGYAEGLVYRARMTVRGDTLPTDVCLVMPGKRGYEHWPHTIDAIELSDIRLQHWDPDTPLPCE